MRKRERWTTAVCCKRRELVNEAAPHPRVASMEVPSMWQHLPFELSVSCRNSSYVKPFSLLVTKSSTYCIRLALLHIIRDWPVWLTHARIMQWHKGEWLATIFWKDQDSQFYSLCIYLFILLSECIWQCCNYCCVWFSSHSFRLNTTTVSPYFFLLVIAEKSPLSIVCCSATLSLCTTPPYCVECS